jgi:hypothetical protein
MNTPPAHVEKFISGASNIANILRDECVYSGGWSWFFSEGSN